MSEPNPNPILDLIVAGLGNPEPAYARTRHNLGFRCLEEVALRLRVPLDRRRWNCRVGKAPLPGGGGTLWLLTPQTFMNLSGRALGAAARDLGLRGDLDRVWVVYDELDLPLCRLRIRRGGSAAGHNGLRSLIGALGPDFVRFRVGVGKPPSPTAGVGYVLGRFSKREEERLSSVIPGVADALEMAIADGVERAMEIYNRAGALGCEELP